MGEYKIIKDLNSKGSVKLVLIDEKPYVLRYVEKKFVDIFKRLETLHIRNIANVLSVEQEEEGFIIIEEFIEGMTLYDYLESVSQLDTAEVIEISVRICNILMEIHNLNPPIIHRDLKLSNIIRTFAGEIYIVDFDAARQKSDDDDMREEDTNLLGTHGYAAPEQYGFGTSDERTDIYALGIIINSLIQGHLTRKVIMQHPLTPIISKCLFVDKSVRYVSVAHVKEELLECVENFRKTVDENFLECNENDPVSARRRKWLLKEKESFHIKEIPGLPYVTEYFCTHCGAILNKQKGYNPDNVSWVCSECGALLYGEEGAPNTEKYPDVSWYCDKCGDFLNIQQGFRDTEGIWKCLRCGYVNQIDDDAEWRY